MESSLSPPLPQDIALAEAQPPLPPDTLAQIVSQNWVVAKGEGTISDSNYGDDVPASKRRRTEMELENDADLFGDDNSSSIELQMDEAMGRGLFAGDSDTVFGGTTLFEDLSSDDDNILGDASGTAEMEEGEVQSEESQDSVTLTQQETTPGMLRK